MAHSHRTKTSSLERPERVLDLLQRLIRSNPLVSLAVGAVGVGGVVATSIIYLENERTANNEIQHKSEIAQIQTRDTAELSAVTTPLNQRIEDLSFRLASIERRVPDAGPLYLDITSITKSYANIRPLLLSGRYTSYDNDSFFVAVPPGSWKLETTDELSHIKSMYPLSAKVWDLPEFRMLAQVISKSSLFLWQGNSNAQVFSNFLGKELDFTFRPSISVQHITIDSIKQRIEAATEVKTDLEVKLDDIKQQLAGFKTKFNNLLGEMLKTEHNVEETNALETAKREAAKSALELQAPTTREDKIKILEELALGDLINYVFFGELGRMSNQNETWPVQNQILSIQHKGNVFYIQNLMIFKNVEITVNENERHHVDTTSVDQEIIFFSRGNDGYLVKTLLPSVPDRADNFTWVNSWLAGLQIPSH